MPKPKGKGTSQFKKKCVKPTSYPCGFTCIARRNPSGSERVCHNPLKKQAATFTLWLAEQEKRLAAVNAHRTAKGRATYSLREDKLGLVKDKLSATAKTTEKVSDAAIASSVSDIQNKLIDPLLPLSDNELEERASKLSEEQYIGSDVWRSRKIRSINRTNKIIKSLTNEAALNKGKPRKVKEIQEKINREKGNLKALMASLSESNVIKAVDDVKQQQQSKMEYRRNLLGIVGKPPSTEPRVVAMSFNSLRPEELRLLQVMPTSEMLTPEDRVVPGRNLYPRIKATVKEGTWEVSDFFRDVETPLKSLEAKGWIAKAPIDWDGKGLLDLSAIATAGYTADKINGGDTNKLPSARRGDPQGYHYLLTNAGMQAQRYVKLRPEVAELRTKGVSEDLIDDVVTFGMDELKRTFSNAEKEYERLYGRKGEGDRLSSLADTITKLEPLFGPSKAFQIEQRKKTVVKKKASPSPEVKPVPSSLQGSETAIASPSPKQSQDKLNVPKKITPKEFEQLRVNDSVLFSRKRDGVIKYVKGRITKKNEGSIYVEYPREGGGVTERSEPRTNLFKSTNPLEILPEKSIKMMRDAISSTDINKLEEMLYPGNQNWRKMFEQSEGITLPKTIKGTSDAIADWARQRGVEKPSLDNEPKAVEEMPDQWSDYIPKAKELLPKGSRGKFGNISVTIHGNYAYGSDKGKWIVYDAPSRQPIIAVGNRLTAQMTTHEMLRVMDGKSYHDLLKSSLLPEDDFYGIYSKKVNEITAATAKPDAKQLKAITKITDSISQPKTAIASSTPVANLATEKGYRDYQKAYKEQSKALADSLTKENSDRIYPLTGKEYGVEFFQSKENPKIAIAVKDGEAVSILQGAGMQLFEKKLKEKGDSFSISEYAMNEDAMRIAHSSALQKAPLSPVIEKHFPDAVSQYNWLTDKQSSVEPKSAIASSSPIPYSANKNGVIVKNYPDDIPTDTFKKYIAEGDRKNIFGDTLSPRSVPAHQMRFEDYKEAWKNWTGSPGYTDDGINKSDLYYKKAIDKAIAEGKTIHPDVMKDYNNLDLSDYSTRKPKRSPATPKGDRQLSDNDIQSAIKKTLNDDPTKENDSLFPIYVADNLLGRTRENSVYHGAFANDIRYLGKDITVKKLAQAMTDGAKVNYRSSSTIDGDSYQRLMDNAAKGDLNDGSIYGSIPNKRTTTSLLIGEDAIREKAISIIKGRLKEEGVNPNSKKYKEAIAQNVDSVAAQVSASRLPDAKAHLSNLMLLQNQKQSDLANLNKRAESVQRDLNDLKRIGSDQSTVELVQSNLNKINYEITQSKLAYQQDIDRTKQFIDKAIAPSTPTTPKTTNSPAHITDNSTPVIREKAIAKRTTTPKTESQKPKKVSKSDADRLTLAYAKNLEAQRKNAPIKSQQKLYNQYMNTLSKFEEKYFDGDRINDENKSALHSKAEELIRNTAFSGAGSWW